MASNGLKREGGSLEEPPEKKLATLNQVNLLGPPYRWLLPDCRCFYSENLYVKYIGEAYIDRYFKLPSIEIDEAQFWIENPDPPMIEDKNSETDDKDTKGKEKPKMTNPADYTAEIKSEIFKKVVAESTRRLELSATYKLNAAICHAKYVPLYKELFPSHGLPIPSASPDNPPDVAPGLPAADVFTPAFLKAWGAMKRNEDTEAAGLKHVHLECFEIEVFTQAFTKKMVDEVLHFKEFTTTEYPDGLPHQWPNNMNRSGCILNEIGLGPLMDRLIQLYIGPLCAAVYPRLLSEGFEAHHSFIVAYRPDTDSSLGVHDDNSEVTINIAMSTDYSGASLAMYHHAREAHPQTVAKQSYYWRVGAGTMLFHPGEMLHEVLPITEGFRMGMIIWLRSNSFRAKNGCPLCLKTNGLMYQTVTTNKEKDEKEEVRRLPTIGLIPQSVKRAEHWPAA